MPMTTWVFFFFCVCVFSLILKEHKNHVLNYAPIIKGNWHIHDGIKYGNIILGASSLYLAPFFFFNFFKIFTTCSKHINKKNPKKKKYEKFKFNSPTLKLPNRIIARAKGKLREIVPLIKHYK